MDTFCEIKPLGRRGRVGARPLHCPLRRTRPPQPHLPERERDRGTERFRERERQRESASETERKTEIVCERANRWAGATSSLPPPPSTSAPSPNPPVERYPQEHFPEGGCIYIYRFFTIYTRLYRLCARGVHDLSLSSEYGTCKTVKTRSGSVLDFFTAPSA